jgi:serine/threonine protein kinase
MEYLGGDSLAAVIGRIERAGRIDWRLVTRVGAYLARALEFAHGKGLIHQNVTPQNILVGKAAGDTKLVDLMLAAAIDEDPTRPISAAGTPSDALAYMSPERTDRPKPVVDARTDLYSLGATMHAMFTGKPPFTGETVAEVVDQIRYELPPRLTMLQSDVPEALDRLVRRLLAKRPQDRPAGAAELRAELEALAQAHNISLDAAGRA